MKHSVFASRPEVEEIGSVMLLGFWLLVAMLFVAFGGLFAAGVLSAGHILKLPVPCGSSNGCVAVASDPSSRFTGIPIAFFGVVAYIVILCLFMFWTEYTGHVLR